MKASIWFICALAGALALSACGGPNKAALAKQAVQTYWSDIDHFKFKAAYSMLTSGQQQANSFTNYGQDKASFLQSTSGIRAVVGKPSVNGDYAVVPVTLKSPKEVSAKQDLHAYQHLYWEGGAWRVSDDNGGLSHNKD